MWSERETYLLNKRMEEHVVVKAHASHMSHVISSRCCILETSHSVECQAQG